MTRERAKELVATIAEKRRAAVKIPHGLSGMKPPSCGRTSATSLLDRPTTTNTTWGIALPSATMAAAWASAPATGS